MECQRNYADTTVFGGLDKYLGKWASETRNRINSPELLARFMELQLADSSYAGWGVDKRKAWARDVLDWLARAETAAPAKKSRDRSKADSRPSKASVVRLANGGKDLDSPVTAIKGIAASSASKLAKLGVQTIRDLLYFFPRRHLDYSQRKPIAELEVGEEQTIWATVWEARIARLGPQKGTEVIVGDETGNIRAVWFNQPFLARNFPTNAQLVLSGKVSEFKGHKVFESPEWELVEDKELIHTGRLVPVYPLTRGLYPRQVRNLVKRVLDAWVERVIDFLPQEIKGSCRLLDLPEAIIQAHYPDSQLMKAEARRRLAFDELFLLQLGVLGKKRDWQESQPGNAFTVNRESLDTFLSSLPFTLTGAQQRVLQEILSDVQKTRPMSRLLQGEVGSGKTVVATAALLVTAGNGYQGAFMAPTEILAEQHFRTICQILSKVSQGKDEQGNVCGYYGLFSHPVTFALLTGSLGEKEKGAVHQQIQEGRVDIIIGTHALIQKAVEFPKLGLAVIDEQHRFGVLQRLALRQKGFNPHILVMTATPIPRTLALTLYGDLDLSVIDELPPGRQEIKTRWLKPEQRGSAYHFLHQQMVAGQQAFIICPLIEESESIEARAAVAEYERLSKEVFPDLRLGLLHGRMAASEKEKVMQSFRDGKLDILVSTPVVEVGIDVPNATVMLVEAADRFGLSQLHQFRGRVGRGEKQSYCLLLAEKPSPEGSERLKAIEGIQNGFVLAEKDLELRGPGEFFGTRQSGLPDLRMARISDTSLLELARNEAIALFKVDSGLTMPEHRLLAQELARAWQTDGELS
ncbi:MAG: ATP-dependent DNA helicase RecG [Chloroflexi bacterium RBG_13_50_10]|nr:MAG: ATP-dependent DNA helicase RecG [Chloroflexi bacterium RBG_13_50_10]